MSSSATRKILTLRRNAFGITSSDSRKTSPLKNSRLTSGQPGAFETTRTTTTANTTVLASAISVLRRPEAPEALNGRYSRTGGADALIHSSWNCSIVPSAWSAAIASLTQSRSGFPSSKTSPKYSSPAGSRPTTVAFGTWTAVM